MAADASSSDRGRTGPVNPEPHSAPLALYRRYRPATFGELKGQDHVTEPLRQALRNGRVHHAYLFSGPRGCGKTSSARILARSLNCEVGPTPDPCGECASCVALAPSGPGSIDVIEIDAASHGGIDDARDLRERAFYSPVAARYKIYIIDEAHMVTGGGFNALLKLVEEPPPHLKFVFATTEPEKVIPTIRSRTHHYPFRLVPPAVLRELLEEILSAEKIEYEPAVLPVVIRAGAGSVRDTLSVLDQLMAGADDDGLRYDRAIALLGYTDDALLDEMAEAFAAGDGALVFGAIDHVVEAGHDPRRFAMDLLDRLRDLIVLASVPDAGSSGLLDVPEDRLDRMREQAKSFGQERLVRAAGTISNGLVEMRGATSPRLLLELMCAQVLLPAGPQQAPGAQQGAGSASAGELDARLNRLERELATAMHRLTAVSRDHDVLRPAGAARVPVQADQAERVDPVERRQSAVPPAHSGQGRHLPTAGDSEGSPPERASAVPAPGGSPPERTRAAGGSGGSAPERTGTAPVPQAAALRDRWADILDAIRDVRKVAWILLRDATVESVEGNVLTLGFAREGDAKGFGGSGCDQDLAGVLDRMFGARPTIRAVAQSVPGRRSADDVDRTRPTDRRPAAPERAPVPPDSEPLQATDDGPTSGRQETAVAQSPGADGKAARARSRSTGEKSERPSRPDPVMNDDPRSQTDPDQTGPADVTGSDLIMRELGGTVIEEIGEE